MKGFDDPKKGGAGGFCLSPRDLFSRLARRRNEKKEGLLSPAAGKAVVRTRVEPKTFFANERTFLSWLQVAVIVLLLGFGLLDGSAYMSGSGSGAAGTQPPNGTSTQAYIAARISGALIAPVGILFMLYALWIYRQRTMQILRRETVRYDDQRGPVMLVAALSSSCLLAYILSLLYAFKQTA